MPPGLDFVVLLHEHRSDLLVDNIVKFLAEGARSQISNLTRRRPPTSWTNPSHIDILERTNAVWPPGSIYILVLRRSSLGLEQYSSVVDIEGELGRCGIILPLGPSASLGYHNAFSCHIP
jgi:hypothetical protein